MVLSQQFKALTRIGGFFASVWGGVATLVGMFAGGAFHPSFFVPSLLTFGVMFGAAGGISGVTTALLIARGESGHDLGTLPVWRVAFWGFLGGVAPGAVFSLMAAAFGATDVLGLLLTVTTLSGGLGSAISGSAAAAAKRVGTGFQENQPQLPTT